MDSRERRRATAAPFTPVSRLTYRAQLARRDAVGMTSAYYDAGDLSPYNVQALLDLLRGESRVPSTSLDLKLELRGQCSEEVVRDLVARFSHLDAPQSQVRIIAPGSRPVTVGCGSAAEQRKAAQPGKQR